MDFADLIFEIRKELNLTQKEFSRRIYKDQRTVSSYERGKVQPPIEFLAQLSQEFGLEISIKNNKYTIKRGLSVREQMYEFIVNNAIADDYTLKELIRYDRLLSEYGNRLPQNFVKLISDAGIDNSNIVAVLCKDQKEEIGIYYLGEHGCELLFWHPLYINVELPDDFTLEAPIDSDEQCKDKYTYLMNELWLALLQRDIKNVSDEELIQAFYCAIHSLIITKDDRINNLVELDNSELKKFTNDFSLSTSVVKTLVTAYKDIDDEYNITLEISDNEECIESSRYSEIIEIPSEQIVVCMKDCFAKEDLVILKPDYYKKIKSDIINNMNIRSR